MIQEAIRLIIQRIFRDKILMGLVFIGIAAIFMTSASETSENKSKNTEEKLPPGAMMPSAHQPGQQPHAAAVTPPHPQSAQAQPTAPPPVALEPNTASDFVKWWIGGAMDFQATTAKKNHDQALMWMTPEAQDTFKQAFWNDAMADGISNGRLVAAFQPVSIGAQAINPDGSVVVSMKGSLVLQVSGQPADTRQVVTDFLVKKEAEGLRIAAICNRSYQQAQSPMAYSY